MKLSGERMDAVIRMNVGTLVWLLWVFATVSQVHGNTGETISWGQWSVWSVCSTTCGRGLSSRTRHCLPAHGSTIGEDRISLNSSVCAGSGSEIKLCFSQPCPSTESSRHHRSCAQFDSRIFSGHRYTWEPFIQLNDACQLSCRAKGVHFYANLADKAEDGTKCKLTTGDGVCVTGVCKRLGCDQVVESPALLDRCGICQGDGTSCQTISGIFTSTDLKRGLNYVITIPAGSTSINITELQTSRNLLILQTRTGQTFINADTNNPSPSVVPAVGSVFTYSGKSFSQARETISAPGPTNSSVILKLLVRGSNPGIMYTFSVPRAVSDQVLQQIRHHTQPVELPPDPEYPAQLDPPAAGTDEDITTVSDSLAVAWGVQALSEGEHGPRTGNSHPARPIATQSHPARHIATHSQLGYNGDTSSYSTDTRRSADKYVSEARVKEQLDVSTLGVSNHQPLSSSIARSYDTSSTHRSTSISKMPSSEISTVQNVEPKHHDRHRYGDNLSDNTDITAQQNLDHKRDSAQSDREASWRPEDTTGYKFRSHYSTDQKEDDKHQRYKIPKYSQSFPFGEKYKDDHKASEASKHARSNHHAHDHQRLREQWEKTLRDQKSADEGKVRREYDRLQAQADGARSDHASGKTQTHSPQPHHSYRDEQISRERQLQERQALMEERRRRVEEQRLRYNERLKEYKEMLRKRQSEEESRRRASSSSDSQTPRDNPGVDGRSRNIGATYQSVHGQSLSSTSRTQFASHLGRQSLEVVTKTADSIGGRGEVGATAVLSSSSALFESKPGLSGLGPDVSRTNGRHSQGRLSPWERSQQESQGARSPMTSMGSSALPVSNTNNGGIQTDPYQRWRQGTSNQSNPPTRPRVLEPPRLENSIHLDRIQTDYPRTYPHNNHYNYPRNHQSGQQPYSGASPNSALTGVDNPQGLPNNRINGDGLTSPSRLPSVLTRGRPGEELVSQVSLGSSLDISSRVYEWRVSGLTECTHTCGGGVQQTVIVCVDTMSQAVVTDDNCRHIHRPRQMAVTCNTRPCPAEWSPGPWSSCSLLCGEGEQTRSLTCQSRVSATLNITMSSSSCESQPPPPLRQVCQVRPCTSWQVGAWSNCSAACGDSRRIREVKCVDLQSQVMPDESCTDLRPNSEESCNLGECGQGWYFTEWSAECPAECGTGEITRQVFCADQQGSPLPDTHCSLGQRPATSQPCRASRPCGGQWFTGHWSKCNVSCGAGHRRREVLCVKELPGKIHSVVGVENCFREDKPEEVQPCQLKGCVADWYISAWSECSQSCGTGFKVREVRCLNSDFKPSDDCPAQTRPKTRDSCNKTDCRNSLLGDIRDRDSTCQDEFNQCKVVQKARLCHYDYYKTACCKSCSEET